ncbi:hypothetical protein [Nafulsella turpanensis]|uniref:hypothetical protein n=1 Tax=Nafulsella turpanensis TaxID=1265690 RepID=UPI000346BE5A|nr:hypothetical protein [Nafulsella turpanensis]
MQIISNSCYVVMFLFLLWGCEKDDVSTSKEVVEVTLTNTEEYIHDFKICGDEEGATIVTQPQYSEVSEIVRNANTDWCIVYRYKPESDFAGKDFVVIETCSGGIGTVCTDIQTVRIDFTVTNK